MELLSDFYRKHFSDLCCYEDYLMRIDLMGKSHNDKEVLKSLPHVGKYKYIISDDGVIWINDNGERVENPNIKRIPYSAFEMCDDLHKVVIPGSVTIIGEYAFSWCTGLTSVTIPNSVTRIGDDAFSHCIGLKSVTIPDGVKSIGKDAFSGCRGLASVVIPGSVTSIGSYAFNGCSGLTSVTIPEGVTSIGYSVFRVCPNLKSAKVQKGCKISWDVFPSGCKVIRY